MVSADTTLQSAEVLVAPTWVCNLKCTYCFVRNNNIDSNKYFMSNETAARTVDALHEGLKHVEKICIHFYGGEPFLNFSAVNTMVTYAKEKYPRRFTFAATTNGTILTSELLELFKLEPFALVLSIDGPSEVHDECRRDFNDNGTHSVVMEFLEKIRAETSCHVCASSVIRSGWSLKQATDYTRSLNIDSIKAQAIRTAYNSYHALNEDELFEYESHLAEIGIKVIEDLENGRMPLDNRFASRALQLLKGEKRQRFCQAGYATFGITPTGDVLPCILIEDKNALLGNVYENPEKWLTAGEEWRNKPVRDTCNSCEYLFMCGGGCPAMISVCGEEECRVIKKNCEVAKSIHDFFRNNPEMLLGLAGIT